MKASRPLEHVIDADHAALLAPSGQQAHQPAIECYENTVPYFADAALQKLYGSLFASLAYGRVYGGHENASTYVERDGDTPRCVWLYRVDGDDVHVLNEGIRIGHDEVQRFASHIFAAHRAARRIVFHAVQAPAWRPPVPYLRYNCLEDTVLTLPHSAPEYLASLGKSTRSYINRYLNKLKRDFPAFDFQTFAAHEIDPQQVWRIIEFNRSRMQNKGKDSINDDETTRRIIRLAQKCGMVAVLTIGGRICAGTINYRVGDNYFLEAIAHDPAYNDYRLGTLCCYLTICECIARGGGEYHFLWGEDDYKARLGGTRRDLEHLVLYRSHWQMLASPGAVLRDLRAAGSRKLRLWLRDARHRDTVVARAATALADAVRRRR